MMYVEKAKMFYRESADRFVPEAIHNPAIKLLVIGILT